MKRLIDFATEGGRRKVIPLAGFPGVQLTQSTLKQNEFNAGRPAACTSSPRRPSLTACS